MDWFLLPILVASIVANIYLLVGYKNSLENRLKAIESKLEDIEYRLKLRG